MQKKIPPQNILKSFSRVLQTQEANLLDRTISLDRMRFVDAKNFCFFAGQYNLEERGEFFILNYLTGLKEEDRFSRKFSLYTHLYLGLDLTHTYKVLSKLCTLYEESKIHLSNPLRKMYVLKTFLSSLTELSSQHSFYRDSLEHIETEVHADLVDLEKSFRSKSVFEEERNHVLHMLSMLIHISHMEEPKESVAASIVPVQLLADCLDETSPFGFFVAGYLFPDRALEAVSSCGPVQISAITLGIIRSNDQYLPLGLLQLSIRKIPENILLKKEADNALTYSLTTSLSKTITTWDELLTLGEKLSLMEQIDHSLVALFVCYARILRQQPTLFSGTINIENISQRAIALTKRLSQNIPFVREYYWLFILITNALPSSQSAVNDYRISAWNWYKGLAEIHTLVVNEYEGPEKAMVYYFHDSPNPYHVEVMEAYIEFLEDNDDYSFRALERVLEPMNISISRAYVDQLGEKLSEITKLSRRLYDSFQNLYSGASLRSAFEFLRLSSGLQNTHLRAYCEQLYSLVTLITPYDTHSLDSIDQKMVNRPQLLNPEDYPPDLLVQIIKQTTELSMFTENKIKAQDVPEDYALAIVTIRNAFEAYLHRVYQHVATHMDAYTPKQIIQVVLLGIQTLRPHVPEILHNEFSELIVFPSKSGENSIMLLSYIRRAETFIHKLIDLHVSYFQTQVHSLAAVEPHIRENYSADMLREMVIFPISTLIQEYEIKISKELGLDTFHITVAGTAVGFPVFFSSHTDLKTCTGTEILVIDDIDTHAGLPHVRGIITRVRHQPLSHLAIQARERNIPWISLSHQEYESVLSHRKDEGRALSLRALPGTLHIEYVEATSAIIDNRVSGATVPPQTKLRHVDTGKCFLAKENYSVETVGLKAYTLGCLESVLSGKIPNHIAITFCFFEEILHMNPGLHLVVSALRTGTTSLPSEEIEDRLAIIRELISTALFGTEIVQHMHQIIDQNFPSSENLILRSSTNAEDMNEHSAAGIYESIICLGREKLVEVLRRVYSSFYSRKAWNDRRKSHLDEQTARMGVLIQEVIDADYSFVVHTRSPLHSTEQGIAFLEMSPGLGEGLMSGSPIYEGESYQFSFQKDQKKLTYHAALTKSYRATLSGPKLISYAQEYVYQDSKKFESLAKNIFRHSFQIETRKVVGSVIPQDIEGVVRFKRNRLDAPEIFFVQSRDVVMTTVLTTDDHVPEKIQKINVPLQNKVVTPLLGTFPKSIFTLDKSQSNLIDLWILAVRDVVGAGKVIIVPYGSSTYMIQKGKLLWEYVHDLDYIFYVLDAKTLYEAILFRRKYGNAIRKRFVLRACQSGISVSDSPLVVFLDTAIARTTAIYRQEQDRTAKNETTADFFLKTIEYEESWIDADKKTGFSRLQNALATYLDKYAIIPGATKIYYSYQFSDITNYPTVLVASFLQAYLSETRLVAPASWEWIPTIDVIFELFVLLGMDHCETREDFVTKVITKCLEQSVVAHLSPFSIKKVEASYPDISIKILEGSTQMMTYLVSQGMVIHKQDVILIDHIDLGSMTSLLSLYIHRLNHPNEKVLVEQIKQLDILTIPNPSLTSLERRIRGDLKNVQRLYYAYNALIKPIKNEKLSEREAIEYLRSGADGGSVLLRMLELLEESLAVKPSHRLLMLSRNGMRQLQRDSEMLTHANKLTLLSSTDNSVVAFSDECGITDAAIKFAALPREPDILIQYYPVRNNLGKILGYRYYNVGIFPKSATRITGLKEFLSVIEMLLQDAGKTFSRENIWVGYSRPDLVITGPSCGTPDSCSVIAPEILLEITARFLVLSKRKTISYSTLNYKEVLSASMQSQIYSLFKDKKMAALVIAAIHSVKSLRPNLPIHNDIDSLLLTSGDLPENKILIGQEELRFLPMMYFTEPESIKDPWWDKAPKGICPWLSYFGDSTAQKRFRTCLSHGSTEISYAATVESIFQQFKSRYAHQSKLEDNADLIRIAKETIRMLHILHDTGRVNEAFSALQLLSTAREEARQKIRVLWEYLHALDKQTIYQKIRKTLQ